MTRAPSVQARRVPGICLSRGLLLIGWCNLLRSVSTCPLGPTGAAKCGPALGTRVRGSRCRGGQGMWTQWTAMNRYGDILCSAVSGYEAATTNRYRYLSGNHPGSTCSRQFMNNTHPRDLPHVPVGSVDTVPCQKSRKRNSHLVLAGAAPHSPRTRSKTDSGRQAWSRQPGARTRDRSALIQAQCYP